MCEIRMMSMLERAIFVLCWLLWEPPRTSLEQLDIL